MPVFPDRRTILCPYAFYFLLIFFSRFFRVWAVSSYLPVVPMGNWLGCQAKGISRIVLSNYRDPLARLSSLLPAGRRRGGWSLGPTKRKTMKGIKKYNKQGLWITSSGQTGLIELHFVWQLKTVNCVPCGSVRRPSLALADLRSSFGHFPRLHRELPSAALPGDQELFSYLKSSLWPS